MVTNAYTSTLANWDGRLSASTTEQTQPAQGSSSSISASTTSTTPAFLPSTSSNVTATSSSGFNQPSGFANEGQRADKVDLGDALLLGGKHRFTPDSLLVESAASNTHTMFRTMVPFTNTRTGSFTSGIMAMRSQNADEKQDDDDEMAVDAMLQGNPSPLPPVPQPPVRVPSSPLTQSSSPSSRLHSHEPLFTPPPHHEELFTPPPQFATQIPVSLRQEPRARRVLAYVAIPSLPRGVRKTDYQDGGEGWKRKLDSRAQMQRIGRNPIFDALSAGLRHNGAHIQTHVSRKAKGKARAISVTMGSDEKEDWEEDYGTIFVSRPGKRKAKDRESDEDDPSYGSVPRKKKFTKRPKAVTSASGSSPHVPLSQALSKTKDKDKTKTKTRTKLETKRSDRDLLVLDIGDVMNPPRKLMPTTFATLSSIRHLRSTYEVDGGREKMWEARYDVGEDYPEPIYLADDVARPTPPEKKRMKAKSRALPYPAQTMSPAIAQLGSLPGGVGASSGMNGLGMSISGQYRAEASSSTSPMRTKGKAPRIRVLRSLSPSAHQNLTLEGESRGTIAKTALSPIDDLAYNAQSEMDVVSTDADADGEVDMDYFLNDLGNNSATAGTGAALSDIVMGGREGEVENEQNRGLRPMPAMFNSTRGGSLSSLNIYSSEGYVHTNQSTANGLNVTQPDRSPFLSGPDSVDNAFYSTPNDFTNSPWLSGGEGGFQDHSPVDGTVGSSATDAWNGTIDPSLLGGGELAESQPLSPSSSPPSAVSRAEASSSRRLLKSHTSFDDALPRRQRVPRRRHLDNYVDIDDLDLSASSDSEVSSYVTGRSDNASKSEHESDSSDSDSKPPRVALTMLGHGASTSTSTSTSRNTSEVAPDPRYSAPKRPAPTKSIKRTSTQKEPTLSWCHQCRRNTLHDKMKCTNIRPDGDVCPYRFCILCIEKRYLDIIFDSEIQDFTCPKCKNICNCTYCTAKRGEVYVSSRGSRGGRGGRGGRGRGRGRSHRNSTRGKSTRSGGTTSLGTHHMKPTYVSEPPKNATKYWGTIYGTSGEKIGTAFVGEDDDARVVVPRLTRFSGSRPQSKRRVFVGQIQDSWGLSGYAVKDVDDSQSVDGMDKGKGKAKERDPSSVRMYVGKKPPRFTGRPPPTFANDSLFNQSHPSPSFGQDGNLSDLTPMSSPAPEDWPEPAVGESAHFGYNPTPMATHKEVDTIGFAPELGLSPGGMEIAIALGLGALQVPNQSY